MSDTARKSWRQRPLPAARRFSDNAFVLDEPKLQFYLAAPLVTTNGHRLGTLCAPAHPPHTLPTPYVRRAWLLPRRMRIMQTWASAPLTPPVYVCRRCVVGQKARRFCAEQANMLAGMAELVVRAPRRPQPPRPASGVEEGCLPDNAGLHLCGRTASQRQRQLKAAR